MVKSQDFFATKEPVVFGSLDRSAIVNFVTKETFMLAAEVKRDPFPSVFRALKMFVCSLCLTKYLLQITHKRIKYSTGS